MIHGTLDLKTLVPVPDRPNVFLGTELAPYIWFDGWAYGELHGIPDTNPDDPFNSWSDVFVERRLTAFSNNLQKWAQSDDWEWVFESVDKRVGWTIFLREYDRIPDAKKYDAFIAFYIRAENGFELIRDKYSEIFSYAHLSEQRNERLVELTGKSPLTKSNYKIFHGEKTGEDAVGDHYSWTLSVTVADFFARRWNTDGELWIMDVDANDIVDYITDRAEDEILVDFSKLENPISKLNTADYIIEETGLKFIGHDKAI